MNFEDVLAVSLYFSLFSFLSRTEDFWYLAKMAPGTDSLFSCTSKFCSTTMDRGNSVQSAVCFGLLSPSLSSPNSLLNI